MSDPRIDPRAEALGVYITETINAKWKITSVVYQDKDQSGGNHNIYYTLLDETGKVVPNIPVFMDWNGRNPHEDDPTKVTTDVHGSANIGMYANLDIHSKNGPYFAFVEATVIKGVVTAVQSDVVHGMGLPEHQHVNFLLTYQIGGIVPPPPVDKKWVIASQSPDHIVLEFL